MEITRWARVEHESKKDGRLERIERAARFSIKTKAPLVTSVTLEEGGRLLDISC